MKFNNIYTVVGVFCLIFICLSGCAHNYYYFPYSGMSAERQETIAIGVSKTFSNLDYSKFKGRNTALLVTGLEESSQGSGPVEEYIYSFVEEKIFSVGGQVTDKRALADTFLFIRLRSSGIQTTERELSFMNWPIYYGLNISGFSGVEIAGFDAKSNEVLMLHDDMNITERERMYLMKMIGEIKLEWRE